MIRPLLWFFLTSLTPSWLESVEIHKGRVLSTCPRFAACGQPPWSGSESEHDREERLVLSSCPQVPGGVIGAAAEAHERGRGLAVPELGVHLAEAALGGAGDGGALQLRDNCTADTRDVLQQSGFAPRE